jgi:hypothetical protein
MYEFTESLCESLLNLRYITNFTREVEQKRAIPSQRVMISGALIAEMLEAAEQVVVEANAALASTGTSTSDATSDHDKCDGDAGTRGTRSPALRPHRYWRLRR